MKFRTDFVTNSSSSSFIITNTSNRMVSPKGIAYELKSEFEEMCNWRGIDDWTFNDFIDDAVKIVANELQPGDHTCIICDDCGGPFECTIQDLEMSNNQYETFSINFDEDFH